MEIGSEPGTEWGQAAMNPGCFRRQEQGFRREHLALCVGSVLDLAPVGTRLRWKPPCRCTEKLKSLILRVFENFMLIFLRTG